MKKKTIIRLSITLIVIVALGLWINSRWSAWFHNEEELPYAPLSEPGRVLLTFGDENELSRNISWQYDSIVVSSHVDLVDTLSKDTIQIEAQGETFRSRSGIAAYYVAKLRSLHPDRYYTYRVCNEGKASPWYSFRTYNQSTRKDYSFMYVGDVQDSIHGKANDFFREALRRHPDTEFFVFGGDLTERPTEQRWEETYRGLDSIGQRYPVITVTGNHEYLKYIIRKLERRFSLVFSYYLDSMVGENQVYTLKYNDMQIFCLDSNREFFYLWTQKKMARRTTQEKRCTMENRRAPSSAVLHQRKHEQPVPAHHVQPTGREIWCRPRTARTRTRLCPYDRPRRKRRASAPCLYRQPLLTQELSHRVRQTI